jgi:tetratricopeptide (TPR) repeat protein
MILRQVALEEPRPVRLLNDAVPRDLETVCLKAMAKEPQRRYASAADLAADLRRWIRGEPLRARPTGRVERVWRFARRRPVSAALVTTLGMVLVVGSMIVTALWRRAERSAAEARGHLADSQQNLLKAREVVDRFYGRFYVDGLLNKPGMEKYRGEVLRDMLAYYSEFVRQGGNDPTLRRELAEASMRVGYITIDLGDKRDALAALEHSRDLLEGLVRERPRDREVRRRLAVCFDKIGAVLTSLGRAPEAMVAHRRECDLNRELVAIAPEDLLARRYLGTSLGMLANAYLIHGDMSDAKRYYGEARTQFRELLRRDPANHVTMGDLAMTLNNMSMVETDLQEQLILIREALTLREALAAGKRDPIYDARNLARTRQRLGDIYVALSQLDKALPLLIEARDGLRQVVQAVPGHVIYRGDLAAVSFDLASLLNRSGKFAEAIESARESTAILDDLARVDPANAVFRGLLAEVHDVAAHGHESLGHADAALGHRRIRLSILERLSADHPNDTSCRDELSAERKAIDRLLARATETSPAP